MTLALPTSHIALNTTLYRIVQTARRSSGALFFGPLAGDAPAGRFDSATSAFRVCYLAESERGAFAESLLRRATLPDPVSGIRVVAMRDVAARAWAAATTTRTLRLADLRGGVGLSAIGVTGAVTMGDSHVESRRISDRIHALDLVLDGIHFRARHDPDEGAITLFDRAADALAPVVTLEPLLDNLSRLGVVLDYYRIGIDE